MRRGAFRAAAGLARLRVGRRPAAGHTLVVRSTSYGDFVNLLPFLSVLEAERGTGAVDLLLLSRVGPVGNSFLPAFKGRIVTLEVNAGAVSIAGIGRARRLVGARAWEVLYLGQSTEEPWARLKKLGIFPPQIWERDLKNLAKRHGRYRIEAHRLWLAAIMTAL